MRIVAVVTACLAATLSVACDDSRATTSPSAPSTLDSPGVAPSSLPGSFTFRGVVTEYRMGPLANVTVRALPNNGRPPWTLDPRVKTTLTDANGFYQIDGLTEATSVD